MRPSLPEVGAVVLLLFSATACGTRALPDPAQTDAALDEGRALALPVEGEWPRLGIQWTYRVTATGFPPADAFPPRIAYRLTTTNDGGHPWCGWWMYGKNRGMEFTGATIGKDRVFFHPPRLDGFSVLEYAPFPEANPGKAGTSAGALTLGKGYGADEARSQTITHRNVGEAPVESAAGRFGAAWLVEGESPAFDKVPSWKSRFWWLDRVGWIRMEWDGSDGRRLILDLESVRDVGKPR